MNKVKEFLENYMIHILCVLFLLIVWNNCSQSKTNGKLVKQNNELILQLDSIRNTLVTKDHLSKQLQIEGLRTEKRMIQSTDRKMMDLNRQTEIDSELKKLGN